jgi:hypothetical protein
MPTIPAPRSSSGDRLLSHHPWSPIILLVGAVRRRLSHQPSSTRRRWPAWHLRLSRVARPCRGRHLLRGVCARLRRRRAARPVRPQPTTTASQRQRDGFRRAAARLRSRLWFGGAAAARVARVARITTVRVTAYAAVARAAVSERLAARAAAAARAADGWRAADATNVARRAARHGAR